MKRPLLMLTLNLGETYNKLIEVSQKAQKSQSNMTDERGYFIAYENQQVTHDNGSYTIKKALGQGSFGRVMMVDSDNGMAALKICRAQPYFVSAMKTEIEVFKLIVSRHPEMTAKFYEDFVLKEHVCYSMELFDMTLYQKLKQTQGAGFDLPTIQKLARQFGQWLVWMKDLQIVHTDMKPENMVLKGDEIDHVKLIDFGSAVLMNEGARPTYIQSRFYRAPEITFGIRYDYKIDCWSIGGLLLELHTGYTCFPARSTPMLVKMFISLLGVPPKHLVLDEQENLRPKVEKYFVKQDLKYWQKNQSALQSAGQQEDDYIYLSEEVLNVEHREQCAKRDMQQLIVNKQRKGSANHSDQDYQHFYEVIVNLLQWDKDQRWGGEEILNSAFCQQQME